MFEHAFDQQDSDTADTRRSRVLPRPGRWGGRRRRESETGECAMSRVLGGTAGRVGEEVQVERGPLGPVQFWRGESRYIVGELLDSWVETAPWWQQHAMASGRASGRASGGASGRAAGGASADLVAAREVWRVEAVR